MVVRVYLDNCCYNWPFDDQAQLRIRLETEAKLAIQVLMRADALEYVWSDMLVSEAGQNPSPDTREKVLAWRDRASACVPVTPDIERHAAEIMRRGVKTADALHLACAASAGCDWFFTVDKGIYNKVDRIGAMRVANPLDFVKEAE